MLNQTDMPPLASRVSPGAAPAVLFLPGFRSDMGGAKALQLEQHCRSPRPGVRALRLSRPRCVAGEHRGLLPRRLVLGRALDHRRVAPAPLVLVGSSMGAWIMLLAALARPARIAGLIGVAAAPDFTQDLILPSLTAAQRERLDRGEVVHLPSAYGEPTPITRRLLDDGAERLVLRGPLPIRCPVHLLHGQADPDVPWTTTLRLAAPAREPGRHGRAGQGRRPSSVAAGGSAAADGSARPGAGAGDRPAQLSAVDRQQGRQALAVGRVGELDPQLALDALVPDPPVVLVEGPRHRREVGRRVGLLGRRRRRP